jgi:1,3-beta-glucanosyltransferase GAS5
MTHVFSGGLVYEYSEERKYGLVNISDSGITEMEGFGLLQRAFKKTPSPTDDGGYNSRGGPSECPQRSDAWNISRHSLPVIPKAAAAYIKDGAGPGPYYIGNKGSQWSGNPSTEWAEFSMPKIEDHSEGGTITIPSRDSKQKSTGTPSAAASPYLTMVASILGLSVIWL